ncbi:amidoligase family protein [Marinobacter sp.]|jgi:hypothetical protein|uniref:amidoligase family protein n=1 Tax=Marinobacter sp. TaxID=50741 RepID=UPI000C919AED|nr:amidoligase family protein [Marinobacter sp.]MAK49782.1 hypothetical protein [Marinobacter sp.]|tara:strand:- start:2289 stop:3326 length:1038 start_codon:yes stop_codon:yes gene_type:complete
MLNKDDFTFGVEMEYKGVWNSTVTSVLTNAGINAKMIGYSGGHPSGVWRVTTDATVSERYNYSTGEGLGGEIVSPVLTVANGFAELKKVCDAVNTLNDLSITSACGIHVHLYHPDMTCNIAKKVALRYGDFSAYINGFLPRSRRTNRWAQNVVRLKNWLQQDTSNTLYQLGRRYPDKYYSVNLRSLAKHQTIEFRQHGGSTDYTKISNWVKFLMGFTVASSDTSTVGNFSTYSSNSSKAFGEVREILDGFGYKLVYGSRGVWKVLDSDNNFQAMVTNETLFTFYNENTINNLGVSKKRATNKLNENFTTWISQFTNQTTDSLYNQVDPEVESFLQTRTNHFANAS